MADTVKQKIYFSELFNIYKNLLPDKQKEYMELYFIEDYSLSEIATLFAVSKIAIHNQIDKAKTKLIQYEAELSLYHIAMVILPQLERAIEENNKANIWQEINLIRKKIIEKNLEE